MVFLNVLILIDIFDLPGCDISAFTVITMSQSYLLPGPMADLWKLGHHNPDQSVSTYCLRGALRPRGNCLLQSAKSCTTYHANPTDACFIYLFYR